MALSKMPGTSSDNKLTLLGSRHTFFKCCIDLYITGEIDLELDAEVFEPTVFVARLRECKKIKIYISTFRLSFNIQF
jgi:hypothetical protein